MKQIKKIILTTVASLSVLTLIPSCKTTAVEVADDSTSREIIQMAQTAYDSGHPDQALEYYNILLKRYGMDTATYIEGRYEIAHIYVKQKKYAEAQPILQEIVDLYNSVQPGMLPGAFKKLAANDLAKIPAKFAETAEESAEN